MPPPLKPRPPLRERLAAVELIVRIVGGVVAVVAALVGLYFSLPAKKTEAQPTPPPPSIPYSSSVPTSTPVSPPPSAGTSSPGTSSTGTSSTHGPPTEPPPPPPTTTPPPKYREFTLSVDPGIAYDLEDLSNYGWSGDDPGYARRDLYRTSKTAGNNRLQGVQVPVTSAATKDMNFVGAVAKGSSPADCAGKATMGGGFVSLDSATVGTTFCLHTRAGHWAVVEITKTAGRSSPIGVRVTMPR